MMMKQYFKKFITNFAIIFLLSICLNLLFYKDFNLFFNIVLDTIYAAVVSLDALKKKHKD